MPVAAAILVGLAAGRLAGGRTSGLEATEIKYQSTILVVFIVQGLLRGRLGTSASASLAILGWTIASLALAAMVLANYKSTALALVGVGTLMNVLVVTLNGHMPVFPGPGAEVSKVASALASSEGFYQLGGASTVLPILADVVPLHLWSSTYFMSAGDLVLMAGVSSFVIGSMLEQRRPARSQKRDAEIMQYGASD